MIHKIKLILFVLLFLFVGQVQAITPADQQSLDTDSIYYWGNGVTNVCQSSTGSTTTEPPLVGSDNQQKAWNYFISQGLTVNQTAGVIGNLMDESHMDPTILQAGGDSQNPSDAGTSGADGWGIAQWSPGGKITGIAQSLNVTTPIYDLGTQLDIVFLEMKGTSPVGAQNMLGNLKQTTDLATATEIFEQYFEEGSIAASGNPNDDGDLSTRVNFAQEALALYGSSTGNSGSTNASGCNSCNTTTTTPSTTSSSSSGTTPSTNPGPSAGLSTLSQTRQSVVCIAEQENTLWSSQPGYPTPTYAATGLLKYTQGIYEEWCADFTSWVYNQAQYPLQPDPNWIVPGVAGIQTIGEANTNFHWHPESTGYVPVPGDLAVHSTASNPDYHINIFISSTAGVSTYIGGDQGSGPYGASPPTTTPPNPPSGSIVSTVTSSGYYSDDIIGYVSPD